MHAAFEGPTFLVWLEASGFAVAMRQWLWLYPVVEIIHLFGIVMLVGAAAMFDLRLLGWSSEVSVTRLGRHLLPWSVAGLGVVVVTGLMMFVAHATEFWFNPAFVTKMGLILFAGINALTFHQGVYATADAWDTGAAMPRSARVAGVASLGLWAAVIACGRLIAYV